MVDCHVHSSFSGDSDMKPEIACETAIEVGLSGISFTDHLDYDYPGYDEVFLIDFDKYSSYIDGLKEQYKNKIKVLKGIEVGVQPHVIESSLKVVNKYDFDIVIGSVHIVDKTDLHNGDFCENKTQKEAYQRYLEEVLYMVKSFDNFDMLGHIDLIRRYGKYQNTKLDYKEYSEIIDSILKILVDKGKCLEINTSGYRYNLDATMPEYDILKRFKELGGNGVCLSSDAHVPKYIGYKFDIAKELLAQAGFKYTVHYEKRQAVYTRL